MKLPETFVPGSKNINVIIETPKGSGNKYTFDPGTQFFKLSKILPGGLSFPLHFGFIPRTKGEDGDPLDVLVLMDEPSYPGNLIECKLLGVIEAEQTERNGETMRNDRLIASAIESHRYKQFDSLKDLDKYLVEDIVKFFITYNEISKKVFKPLGNKGPGVALKLIKEQLTDE
ncbi:MAG TPA: inorganic diphosphatase [Chitinophagaceae bacterium]|nr:inorganic diphosphatase [Chitinophagaceae bacterium]